MTESDKRRLKLTLTIVYESDEDGWVVVSIPAIPGVLSQGRTREEARENALDALGLMLSPEPAEAGDTRERELLHLEVDAVTKRRGLGDASEGCPGLR
jgi:predicted RNase H-like HicB family nuclease